MSKVQKYAVGFEIVGTYPPVPWERYALLTAEEAKKIQAYLDSRTDFERCYVRPFDLADLVGLEATLTEIREEFGEEEPEEDEGK